MQWIQERYFSRKLSRKFWKLPARIEARMFLTRFTIKYRLCVDASVPASISLPRKRCAT